MDECNSIEPDNCAVHGWGASAPEVGLTEAEALAAMCKDAFYRARDIGGTMHTAADDAARAILTSDWLAERDARIKADAIAQERAESNEMRRRLDAAMLRNIDYQKQLAERDAQWVAKIEALAKDWQRTSDEFAEGNGGWNKVMRYKDAAATLRALLPSDATAACACACHSGGVGTGCRQSRCEVCPPATAALNTVREKAFKAGEAAGQYDRWAGSVDAPPPPFAPDFDEWLRAADTEEK